MLNATQPYEYKRLAILIDVGAHGHDTHAQMHVTMQHAYLYMVTSRLSRARAISVPLTHSWR